jgi:hypothetical protein
LLTDLPIGAIERAMVHDPGDQILVLAKSIDLSWENDPCDFHAGQQYQCSGIRRSIQETEARNRAVGDPILSSAGARR